MRAVVIWIVGIFISISIDGVKNAIDRHTEAVKATHCIKGDA